MVKQLFISHAWGNDELQRDNHARCKLLYHKLIEKNYSVWLDDNEMYGNIDSAIMKGINNAKAIIVCLTESYCNKINNAVLHNLPNDNCYKEWNYSLFKQKIIIPVIMEPRMRDIYVKQDGVVQMYFNSTLYIDASEDLDHAVNKICFTLKNKNIYNEKFTKKFQKIKMLDSILTLINFKPFNNNNNNNNDNNNNNNNNNNTLINKSFTITQKEAISDIYKKALQLAEKETQNNSNEPPLPKYTSVRLSPLSYKSENISPIARHSNNSISSYGSPIARRSNSSISNSLSPIGRHLGRLSPLTGLSNRLSIIEYDLQKNMSQTMSQSMSQTMSQTMSQNIRDDITHELKDDITKEIKSDLTKEIKHDIAQEMKNNWTKHIKKDLKRDLKKDISKIYKKIY